MSVYIIATGGTFDKAYDPIDERFEFGPDSILPSLLEDCNVTNVSFHQCMLLDSVNIKKSERAKINRCVESAGHDRIVIVHGTSTMTDTARFLAGVFPEKTLVLTGALYPVRYRQCEGSFNLGMAVAAARILPPGVYITMQGQVIRGEDAQKDAATGRFHGKPVDGFETE